MGWRHSIQHTIKSIICNNLKRMMSTNVIAMLSLIVDKSLNQCLHKNINLQANTIPNKIFSKLGHCMRSKNKNQINFEYKIRNWNMNYNWGMRILANWIEHLLKRTDSFRRPKSRVHKQIIRTIWDWLMKRKECTKEKYRN